MGAHDSHTRNQGRNTLRLHPSGRYSDHIAALRKGVTGGLEPKKPTKDENVIFVRRSGPI